MDKILNSQSTHQTQTHTTKCGCDGSGWYYDLTTNTASPCSCQVTERYKKILDNCGISEAFRKMTFETYQQKDRILERAWKDAKKYAADFDKIKQERNHSILFSGQVGAGKTHLSVAISNVLMERGIGVLYFPFKEAITYLKQVKTDQETYQREMNKYKVSPVLLIDDLFKLSERTKDGRKQVNEADVDIMYEIINARYINCRPIIVSTEYEPDYLIDVDQATGSRIIEMCKGRIVQFKGKELNHRLI